MATKAKNSTVYKVIALSFTLLAFLYWGFSAPEKVEAAPNLPPIYDTSLISATLHASSPQVAVSLVITAFNEPTYTTKINFDGGKQFASKEGEVWVLATDWQTLTLPVGVTAINVQGGYGVWLIQDSWEGFVKAGVGVRVKEKVETPNPSTTITPTVTITPTTAPTATPTPPDYPLVHQTLAVSTAQESVEVVVKAFDAAKDGNRQNFAGGATTVFIPENQYWLIATDWGATIPTAVHALKVEGGYGTWWVTGPVNLTISNGVAVRLLREVFLPLVTSNKALPVDEKIEKAATADSAQKSVAIVVEIFNDPATEGTKQNFATENTLTLAAGQIELVATNFGANIPASANPLKVAGGYGTWWVEGPATLTVLNGVGIRIK